jgi:conjugative relaxase-like TrwC/TraI family protein
MLRITQSTSAGGAMSYFSRSDYYSEGQELVGRWHGEGAKRLGLAGEIKKHDWDALCNNRHPASGERLTLRTKENRRVGYDFTFDAHKSVSLLYAFTKDERILDAFRDSVRATMGDIESEIKTRVRKDGKNTTRTTGNIVWGEYAHFTSRPVDGVPDPHMHIHAYVFNATWDKKESAWKAGEFGDLKRDARYFEAKCDARFARRLAELGIAIERTKTGWEVGGIPVSAIRKFSRRTAEIEAEAKRKGVVDAAAKSELGAKTREHKKKNLTFDQLRAEWSARLSAFERAAIEAVGNRVGGRAIGEDAKAPAHSVRHAMRHWFERKSVVPERTVLAEAMRHAIGKASPEAVEDAFRRHDFVFGEQDGRRMVTTKEVLAEEMRMLAFARDGRGTEAKLATKPHVFSREWLNQDQRGAVEHVLQSRDRVIMISGKAGVGKTSMMQEATEAIEAAGKRVFTFAPSAEASRGVLRGEGFKDADTVARLLVDTRLHETMKGQVIWIDEAGLIGTRTMAGVFDLASKLDARVILSGDRRQHGSVERGSVLRLLEEQAGVVPAEIKDIRRQKGCYKQAVQVLSEGRIAAGFHELDRLGWVREVADDERYKRLAADYVHAFTAGTSALAIAPTHREGDRITSEIRADLKRRGRLQDDERPVLRLVDASLTEAQRRDAVYYANGDVLEFHQNAKGFRKGQRLVVGNSTVPLAQAGRFQVYRAGELAIASGDVIRITKNGATADGHRLNNGARYTVKGFNEDGDMVLDNGLVLGSRWGHIGYGYVSTSHASQGKTVDKVLIGMSPESYPAMSREQFYVSVSRGRERATIYAADKNAILEAIVKSDDRLAATEFVGGDSRQRGVARRLGQQALAPPEFEVVKHDRQGVDRER